MSQWSEGMVIDGARFAAHIDGAAFCPVSGQNLIDAIMLIDDGGDIATARQRLEELRRDFVGRGYGEWRRRASM